MVERQKIPGMDLGASSEPQVIRILVKTPWQKEEFLVYRDMLARELKEHVGRHFSSSPDHVVLVHAGRILKDHKTLGQHGIHLDSSATVYVVFRSRQTHPSRQASAISAGSVSTQKPPRSSPFANEGLRELTASLGLNTANFAEFQSQLMSKPDLMLQLLETPFIQNKLASPDLMKELVTSSPQVQQVMEKAPQISRVFGSPEGMRLVVELARNPAAVREIIKSPTQALSYPRSVSGGDNNSVLQDTFVELQDLAQKATPKMPRTTLLPSSTSFDPGKKPAQAKPQLPCPRSWPQKHSGAQNLTSGSDDHSNGESGTVWGEAGQLVSVVVKNLLHQIVEHLMQTLASSPCRNMVRQGRSHTPDLVAKTTPRNPAASGKAHEQAILQVPSLLQQIQNTDVLLAHWSPKEIQSLLHIQQRLQALATDDTAGRAGRTGRPARRAHSITSLCDLVPSPLRAGRQDLFAQQILQAVMGTDFADGAKPISRLRGSSAQPSSKQKRTYKL